MRVKSRMEVMDGGWSYGSEVGVRLGQWQEGAISGPSESVARADDAAVAESMAVSDLHAAMGANAVMESAVLVVGFKVATPFDRLPAVGEAEAVVL